MEKNPEIYFDEDYNKKYLEFIKSKNTLSSIHINLYYEFLEDLLNDDGLSLITWIGKTNFRKYIFEINSEEQENYKKLEEYIEFNNLSKDESLTLKILRKQVEEKIECLHKNYRELINDIETQSTFSFENNFDSVIEDEVYKYFKENLVDKKFLDKSTFEDFLKKAFEEKISLPIKERFKFNTTSLNYSKTRITKIFGIYYVSIAQRPHGKKENYVGLLKDYFIDYNNKSLSSNFTRSIQHNTKLILTLLMLF